MYCAVRARPKLPVSRPTAASPASCSSVLCRFICMPRSSNTATLSARRDAPRRLPQQQLVDAAAGRVVRHGDRAERTRRRSRRSRACARSRRRRFTRPSCTTIPTSAARQNASVPGATCEVDVGHPAPPSRCAAGRSRSSCARVVGDLLQRGARERGKPCALPRVLADEQRPPRSARSRRARHPRTSCRSPRTRRSSPATAHWRGTSPSARSVAPLYAAAEVVPLPATAVIEDRLATVVARRPRASAARPRGSPCPSRSPRTSRPRADASATQPVGAVLVVVEAQRLLAQV
jgi:hypothetical protein